MGVRMMTKSFMAAAAVATLVSIAAGAVPAIAALDTGVPAYDRSTRTLYVNNAEYYLPTSLSTVKFWDADKVTVNWELQGDRRVIKGFSVEREDEKD
jgi:hypothetical protein